MIIDLRISLLSTPSSHIFSCLTFVFYLQVTYWNTRDGAEASTKFQEVSQDSGRVVNVANLEAKLTYKFQVRSYQEFGDNLVLGPQSKIHSVTIGTLKEFV
jgi:hypothetical protein